MPAVTNGIVTQRVVTRSNVKPQRCAYCGALLPVNIEGIEAWRIGDHFVCNEFCADGIPQETIGATRPAAEAT